ncbi:MAG: murein biosynthesis integral membrane protein MurJ [Elusimicrobiota bacterium]
MSEKSTVLRNSSALAAVSLFSKILGYARDAVFAWLFGAGKATDAYYAALRLITFFRKTAAESNINPALSPALHENSGRIREVSAELASAASLSGLTLSAAVFIFSTPIIKLFAFGFDRHTVELASRLLSVMSLQIFFISLTSLWQGILNHTGSFAKPALIQTIFSVSVISAAIIAGGKDPQKSCFWAAAAGTASGIFQVGLFSLALYRRGLGPSFRFPSRKCFKLLSSAFFSLIPSNYDYFFITVNLAFAAFFPQGTLTVFYNAARLAQFPLSLASSPAAAAAAGEIARNHAQGNLNSIKENFINAVSIALFWTIPSALGLWTMAMPLSSFLFERGAYSSLAAASTAEAIRLFSLSLPFYAVNKILISFFYSIKREKLALKFFFTSLGLLVILSPLFPGGHRASLLAALAVSSSGALWGLLKIKKEFDFNFNKLVSFTLKAAAAGAIACLLSAAAFSAGINLPFSLLIAVSLYLFAAKIMRIELK